MVFATSAEQALQWFNLHCDVDVAGHPQPWRDRSVRLTPR
jgi:hypothetical protein